MRVVEVLFWSLELDCPLRRGVDPSKLDAPCVDRTWYWSLTNEIRSGDWRDGICRTESRSITDPQGVTWHVPSTGFRMSDLGERWDRIGQDPFFCQKCEANVGGSIDHDLVTNCHGSAKIDAGDHEQDDEYWRVIHQKGLEDRLYDHFHVTRPLNYGFWIRTPLRRPQLEFLCELFDGLEDKGPLGFQIRSHAGSFQDYCRVAMNWELPLHVYLKPQRGSLFFGHLWVPSCALCHAPYEEKPFIDPDSYICPVCGHQERPMYLEEEGVQEIRHEPDPSQKLPEIPLLEIMGREAYIQMATETLAEKGACPDTIQYVLQEILD